jgi:hypothetical protein
MDATTVVQRNAATPFILRDDKHTPLTMIGRKLKMMLRRQQERKKHDVRSNAAKLNPPPNLALSLVHLTCFFFHYNSFTFTGV